MFHVLVLDDEAERHRAFVDVLEGCEVQHVSTASEAKVALIEEDIFDLVCLDHDLGTTSRRSNTGMAVAEFIARDMRDKIPGHVLIHSNNVARPIGPEPDRVTTTLEKGTNTLMLKVTQNNLPWGAIVRVKEAKPVEAKVGERLGDGIKQTEPIFRLDFDHSAVLADLIVEFNDGRDVDLAGQWRGAPRGPHSNQ